MKKTLYFMVVIAITLFFVKCNEREYDSLPNSFIEKGANDDVDLGTKSLLSVSSDDLTEDEIDGLYFMREEEKLAHDVYLYLGTKYGNQVFINITESEERHTAAVLKLILNYGLTDPATGVEGEFNNEELQELYDALIEMGDNSVVEALLVGALIEETDIEDIAHLLEDTDNEDIIRVYNHLLDGSENHLRAFVQVLLKHDVIYSPQILSQEDYDAIINAED